MFEQIRVAEDEALMQGMDESTRYGTCACEHHAVFSIV